MTDGRAEWRAEWTLSRHPPPGTATRHPKRIHGTQRETGDRIRCCGISPQLIIRFPVSPCLQVFPAANRQPLTANTYLGPVLPGPSSDSSPSPNVS